MATKTPICLIGNNPQPQNPHEHGQFSYGHLTFLIRCLAWGSRGQFDFDSINNNICHKH